MCSSCMGNLQTQTLYACLQRLIDCKNGPFEIFDGKAYVRCKDSQMGFTFVKI